MFGSFGWFELTVILIIVLVVFGAGKLPQVGEGLGNAVRRFKRSASEPDVHGPIRQGTEQVSQDYVHHSAKAEGQKQSKDRTAS